MSQQAGLPASGLLAGCSCTRTRVTSAWPCATGATRRPPRDRLPVCARERRRCVNWLDGRFGHVLYGDMGKPELLRVATTVCQQLIP